MLDSVEEAFDEVALSVEHPVDGFGLAAGWVLLDLGGAPKRAGDEFAQMIGVIGGVGDDVANALQPLDQPARLRAVTPLPGGDLEPDRQSERIDSGVDLGGQTASGASDGASFKLPFREVASAWTFEIVASTSTYSKSGSSRKALKRPSQTPARDQRRNRV